jgi:hypothetical protein
MLPLTFSGKRDSNSSQSRLTLLFLATTVQNLEVVKFGGVVNGSSDGDNLI